MPPNEEDAEADRTRRLIRETLLEKYYSKKLDSIINSVTNEWETHAPPYPYTLHNLIHIEGVEDQIYNLLRIYCDRGDNVVRDVNFTRNPISRKEWFFLLASVWLHDIGMIPTLEIPHDKAGSKPYDIEWRTRKGTITWNRHIRDFHSTYSCDYIKKNHGFLNLNSDELRNVIEIVGHHRYIDYNKVNKLAWTRRESPNQPRNSLLISYLRLADNLQIKLPRNPDFQFYMAMGLDISERFHWFKSIFAQDVQYLPDEYTIKIVIKRPKQDKNLNLKPLMDTIQTNAQNELDAVKDIIARGRYPLYLKIECDSEEVDLKPIELQELRECLNNLHLFDPALTPNAGSVADTVIEQLKNYLKNQELVEKAGTYYFKDYLNNILKDMKNRRPCHVALHTIYNTICNILNENGREEEKLRKIEEFISKFQKNKEKALAQIPKKAYKVISDGSPILLYGYSTTIVRCLKYYLEKRKENIELFICEGRSKTSYRHNNRLEYSDFITYARDLLDAEKQVETKLNINIDDRQIPPKFKINYVTDSCAAYLFQCHKVSKVLVGANGIGLSGDVAHSLGHLTIADTAHCHEIPLYVIADGSKIDKISDELIESDYKCGPPGCPHPRFRENQWLTTDIDFEPELSNYHNFNPRGDFIPAKRIKAIITEKGVFNPTQFRAKYANGGQNIPCEIKDD